MPAGEPRPLLRSRQRRLPRRSPELPSERLSEAAERPEGEPQKVVERQRSLSQEGGLQQPRWTREAAEQASAVRPRVRLRRSQAVEALPRAKWAI